MCDCTDFWSADHNDDLALKGALCKRISMLGSRQCRSPADWIDDEKVDVKNCFEGVDVRTTATLLSSTPDRQFHLKFIPKGSMGKVLRCFEEESWCNGECEYTRMVYIQWDGWPNVCIHTEMEMDDMVRIRPSNGYWHRFDVDPDLDPTFHFDADPDPLPDWHPNIADPQEDPTSSFKLIGK